MPPALRGYLTRGQRRAMSDVLWIRIVKAEGLISVSEWESLISRDPTLESVATLPGRNPLTGESLDVPAPHSARWTGHPDGVPFYFKYQDGELCLGSSDRHGLRKAEWVAKTLAAVVDASVD